MLDLKHFVRCYDNVLHPEACEACVQLFEQNDDLLVVHRDEFKFAEINCTTMLPLVHELAFPSMYPYFERYAKDLGLTVEWPTDYAFEHLRMKRYLPNGTDEFPPHVDVADAQSATRFLVAFLYLNDVEEGGETLFPTMQLSIKPKAGSLLMFPPLWPWLHAGARPISGPKYIVGTYLRYA